MAQQHPELSVVGVGAGSRSNGDTPELALEFAATYGFASAGVDAIYDVTFDSWRQFGAFSQPWWVYYDAAGNLIVNQAGGVDFDWVRATLAQPSS